MYKHVDVDVMMHSDLRHGCKLFSTCHLKVT